MRFPRYWRGAAARRLFQACAAVAVWLLAQSAFAFQPFVVRDIRIEGAQRTEAGTVFGYLPVKVGDTLTPDKAISATRALYATGFFKDVRLEVDRDVLVVVLEERPAVATIDITGTKEFDKDTIRRALRDIGLAESRVFDRSLLERGEQELKRQYLSRGKYAVQVTSTVTPLERNRVGITLAVEEGDTAGIRSIAIVGNKAFSEAVLLDQFKLTIPNWLTWYTKTDRYAREKLAGDLEALRSFYLDRGYLEFSLDSTQVSITPDKEAVHIVLGITEGGLFKVSGINLGGQLLGRKDELARLVQLKPGDVFSGRRLAESNRLISERLGALGYAFANVNAVPQIDRDKREVAFDVLVDPGRRVYVRRINISGNARTRDEVIRREMRQFEDAWYDSEKIRLSRERIGRLGYFVDVRIDNSPVPDAPDQIDLNVVVREQATGAINFGVGISTAEKLILSASINQQNFLGSGQSLGFDVNTSRINRTVNLSFTDPYYTQDGISRSFDLYTRTFNASALNLGDYRWRSSGAGIRFGVPYTEVDRVSFGVTAENNTLTLGSNPPQRFKDYVASFGESSNALLANLGWRRDSRDSAFAPTRGHLNTANLEITLPAADLRYYRTTYIHQTFLPITKDYTLALNADFGVGRALGGNIYPLFKNFYAGGIGSVRGFSQSSLGPRDPVDNVPLGGQTRLVGNAEFIFPLPGTGNDRSFRSFVFLDVGNVFSAGQIDLSTMRASTGIGLNWASPIGPMKIGFGFPLRRQEGDRLQRMQFQIGSGF